MPPGRANGGTRPASSRAKLPLITRLLAAEAHIVPYDATERPK